MNLTVVILWRRRGLDNRWRSVVAIGPPRVVLLDPLVLRVDVLLRSTVNIDVQSLHHLNLAGETLLLALVSKVQIVLDVKLKTESLANHSLELR